MPATQAISSNCRTINPLVGLSEIAFRLYSALEIFRETYRSSTGGEWFRTPRLDARLRLIGFSRSETEQGFSELSGAGLLQMREEGNIRWYRLK